MIMLAMVCHRAGRLLWRPPKLARRISSFVDISWVFLGRFLDLFQTFFTK